MSKKSAWAGAIVAAAGLTVGGIAVATAADNPDGPPAAFAERHPGGPGGPGKPGRPGKANLKAPRSCAAATSTDSRPTSA